MNIKLIKIKECKSLKKSYQKKKKLTQTAKLTELGSIFKVKESHRRFLTLLMSSTN